MSDTEWELSWGCIWGFLALSHKRNLRIYVVNRKISSKKTAQPADSRQFPREYQTFFIFVDMWWTKGLQPRLLWHQKCITKSKKIIKIKQNRVRMTHCNVYKRNNGFIKLKNAPAWNLPLSPPRTRYRNYSTVQPCLRQLCTSRVQRSAKAEPTLRIF